MTTTRDNASTDSAATIIVAQADESADTPEADAPGADAHGAEAAGESTDAAADATADATEATTEAVDAHGADPHAADDHGPAVPEEVWLLIALVLLLAIAWRPAKRAILGALDSRASRIRAELDEAQRLREEAQSALANAQRRQRDAMKEAEEIIAHARREAERLRGQSATDLEDTLKRREQMAMDRIAQAETAAMTAVRAVAVDVAVNASRELIVDQLDENRGRALIDQSIADLDGKLH